MAVSTNDEMETGGGFRELLVLVIADVSKSCNPSDIGRRLDLVDGALYSLLQSIGAH